MTNLHKGVGREYEGGRSTEGWVKGSRVRNVNELPNGTFLICLSHRFRAENFAVVIEQRPLLPGVWAKWCAPDGEIVGEEAFSIHQGVLDHEDSSVVEYFYAVAYTRSSLFDEPAVVVIELIYEDFEPYGNQAIPYYSKPFYYDTLEEAETVVEALNAEIAKMHKDVRALLTVFIRPEETERGNALETLREIAGYEIAHNTVKGIRESTILSYWHRFTDEDLTRYIKKGADLT